MTEPVHPAQSPVWHRLDADLFARAQTLLEEMWLARDADLAPMLPVVLAPGVATATLEQAVRLNPWVGEPHMVLAQLDLSVGRQPEAARRPRVRRSVSAPGAMPGTSACNGTPGLLGRVFCCSPRSKQAGRHGRSLCSGACSLKQSVWRNCVLRLRQF